VNQSARVLLKSTKNQHPQSAIRRIQVRIIVPTTIVLSIAVLAALLFYKRAVPTVDSSDRAIAKQVETKLQQDSIESAAGKSPVVSLDEHEVNSVVARMVQASLRQSQHVPDRASVRQLTIKLRNDILQAHFVLGIRETEVAFDMEGQLYTADGRLKFDPLSGRIGDLPVPRSILASAATKLLNSPAAHDRTVLPENISDLRVQNGTALPPHRKTLILSAC